MLSCRHLAALFAVGLAACGGGGGGTPDASIDTAPATCTDVPFTGGVIDFTATDDNFCGVFKAILTVRGSSTRTDETNPNGRFELCLPHQAQTLIDVTYSTDRSACAGIDGAYIGHGVLVAEQAVIDANGVFIPRALTQAEQDAIFTQVGQRYTASAAQLIVHVDGTPRAVSIAAAHATTQQFNGTKWEAGNTGNDVLFPNVDPGSTTVTVAGGATGAGAVTLEAGAYTYLSVIAN